MATFTWAKTEHNLKIEHLGCPFHSFWCPPVEGTISCMAEQYPEVLKTNIIHVIS